MGKFLVPLQKVKTHKTIQIYIDHETKCWGEMIKSKLPNNVLGKIWKMADVDKDGLLDADEFALAMHLINIKVDGE